MYRQTAPPLDFVEVMKNEPSFHKIYMNYKYLLSERNITINAEVFSHLNKNSLEIPLGKTLVRVGKESNLS